MCYLQLLTFIALMAINITASAPIDDKNKNSTKLNDEVRDYDQRTANFSWIVYPCRKPQPRAYILFDLLKGSYLKEEETIREPLYIVLNRCDVHSGCCPTDAKICAPVSSKIDFEKIEIKILSLSSNSTRNEWIQVEQHRKCNCMFITSQHPRETFYKDYPVIKKYPSSEESSSS